MDEKKKSAEDSFGKLLNILTRLRAPDGCPWDRKQTAHTLKHSLIEESYETIEAIDSGDVGHIKEELGDLYLLVTMISLIEQEQELFSVADTLEAISEKMVRRHPHVFGDAKVETAEEVLKQWKDIKENVEGREKRKSALDGIPRSLPPLERAYKIQKEASKKGFDWKHVHDVWEKIQEEMEELDEARGMSEAHIEEEIGDVLFSIINICRFYKVDPSTALHKTNEKFLRRFRAVEDGMKEKGLDMTSETFEIMDELWNRVKETEKRDNQSSQK